MGPRNARSIACCETIRGSAGEPVINRAEARLNTGCTRSSMRTYIAPLSRTNSIGASPGSPAGRRTASTVTTATATTASTAPMTNEID